jgi:hypothetical protein
MAWRMSSEPCFLSSRYLLLLPGNVKYAGAVFGLQRRDDSVFLRGQRIQRLHRRSRRIGAAQRAIQQRLVDVVAQRVVLRDGQAADEVVGIEARRARERNDVAGLGVERHHRAALAGSASSATFCTRMSEPEDQVVAGDGRPIVSCGV